MVFNKRLEFQLGTLHPDQAFVEMNRADFLILPEFPLWDVLTLKLLFALLKRRAFTRVIEYIEHSLSPRDKLSDTAKLTIIEAAMLLQNLAWHNGQHLSEVVLLAGSLLGQTSYPLLARENAAAALKNAAWYKGKHLLKAIEAVLSSGFRSPHGSDRITSECVRVLQYASRHSKALLRTDTVRKFLEMASNDTNQTIAGNAQKTLAAIFG